MPIEFYCGKKTKLNEPPSLKLLFENKIQSMTVQDKKSVCKPIDFFHHRTSAKFTQLKLKKQLRLISMQVNVAKKIH